MRSVDDLEVAGKRVLVRCDLNVPMADGRITDDLRIRASVPTLRAILDRGGLPIVMSHLGRPKGRPDPRYAIAPVAARLRELLGSNDVTVLENLRFDPREEAGDPAYAGELAALGDCYVGDGFGALHRAHASVSGVPRLLPHAAGYLVLRELEVLQRLTTDPDRPYVVVLGGAKVADKLGVIANLKADRLLVGGAMCFTFLKAQGYDVGDSLVDDSADVRPLLDRVTLPVDVVTEAGIVPVDAIPPGAKGYDVGPETVARFAASLADAATVFWNGPMGMFENPVYVQGTLGVAKAIASAPGFTVVGGGDSAAAVRQFGIADRFGHISTGGGASLEYLEGRTLPGLAALEG